MSAYIKKEITEYMRTGRMIILGLIFIFFGILNPAMAKLTPWLMEQLAGEMERSGFKIGEVTVSNLSSWEQYFKNLPMIMMVFVLVIGGAFAAEYKSGGFIFAVTRGLKRDRIVLSKWSMLNLLWTVLFAVHTGITYGYTVYFWGSEGVTSLGLSMFFWWLYGVWMISLFVLMAVLLPTVSGALGGTAAVYFAIYLAGMIPAVSKYLPTFLTGGMSLITGENVSGDYTAAAVIAGVSAAVMLAGAVMIFRKKQL
ncbi:MAG: ABC transporter permease [Lachnospiraceae bacterium]|nr:ABC transporter permease [Lachnospiraceae bacterium]